MPSPDNMADMFGDYRVGGYSLHPQSKFRQRLDFFLVVQNEDIVIRLVFVFHGPSSGSSHLVGLRNLERDLFALLDA